MNGHTLVAEQLIAAGAALDVQNNEGYGPCPNCNCLTLLQTGSRLLGRCTALISAALKGHTPVVEQLIAAAAALDVQNNEGYGPCAD
jgi:ankyrin repeat protein